MKIKIKSGTLFDISPEEADRIVRLLSDSKEYATPLTINHSLGFWVGSSLDVETMYNETDTIPAYQFKDKAELAQFHAKYGKHNERFLPLFGHLDFATLYRLDCGIVRLENDGFGYELVDNSVTKEYSDECVAKWKAYCANLNKDGTLLDNVSLNGRDYFSKSELRDAYHEQRADKQNT